MTYALTVSVDTWAKRSPRQSAMLPPNEKILLKAGDEIPLLNDEPAEAQHIKILAAENPTLPDGEWYVFSLHIQVEGTEPCNQPKDEPAPIDKGRAIQLPGYASPFYLGNPIRPGGNFTWGEATHGGSRIPADKSVVEGILRIADSLEEVRSYLGNRPISINSWYRDPATNRRVGGARFSRHLNGDAVDFRVQGMTPHQVYARLNPWWGARGGLASSSTFTHIDARGYRARWSYGF